MFQIIEYVLSNDLHVYRFVYGRNRPCGNSQPGMCLESITIYFGGEAIELQRGWLVNYQVC